MIELLAVIVILAIIALISSPIIINLIENAKKESFKDATYGIIGAGENLYAKELLDSNDFDSITFTYTDGVESSSVGGKKLDYDGAKPKTGSVVINENGKIAIAIHNGTWCTEKGFDDSEVSITEKSIEECVIISEIVLGEYDDIKGMNRPVLTDGMIPIKWDGSTWVNTTIDDTEWYDYTAKKWANVKTDDGSMWVWIPRYIYKISSGWHTNTAGVIDVQYSIITDDTIGGNVTIVNTGNAADSNGTWTNHPAFKFGDTELNGIWVAKFEASVADITDLCYTSSSVANCDKTTLTPKIVPTVKAWRNITSGTAFTVSRNMETNNNYGWGTSGENIDTHLMKNVEWGAAAYLSKSVYGNPVELWINPASLYITGCAGDTAASSWNNPCRHYYDAVNGQKTSTTGNIYGIYDMNGGSGDNTAAYVNNGHASLTTYASSIVNADIKYKDVYTVVTDTDANNYVNTINKKGDALYETSSSHTGSNGWYSDHSYMSYSNEPLFFRGGYFPALNAGGPFAFDSHNGVADLFYGFRPVLLIGEGL